jgi:starch phosphorylase
MVRGCDVWLNNPRRPHEASGTSGMKAVANGALHFSVLDGWWVEGYSPEVGWALGSGEEYDDHDYQDEVESRALYDTLEQEIAPLFYRRDRAGLPRRWLTTVKESMGQLGPVYNTNRMVQAYTERYYLPAARRRQAMEADGFAPAQSLAEWARRVHKHWSEVAVVGVDRDGLDGAAPTVGDRLPVRARVKLGALAPEDVSVQAYHGQVDGQHHIEDGEGVELQHAGLADGTHEYQGFVPARRSGLHGFTVRVLPRHPMVGAPQMMGRIRWE